MSLQHTSHKRATAQFSSRHHTYRSRTAGRLAAAPEASTLYLHLDSQPCRAVALFCRLNKLPVSEREVDLFKGETFQPAFREKISTLGKVPVLHDDAAGLVLPESAAIITYLVAKHAPVVPDHWLPRTDIVARARVESGMHWFHTTMRVGSSRIIWNLVVAPLFGQEGDKGLAKHGFETMHGALDDMQRYWLAGSETAPRPFMAGSEISVADLLAVSELEQLVLLDKARHGTSYAEVLVPFPEVVAWRERVRAACGPVWDDVHDVLYGMAGRTGP